MKTQDGSGKGYWQKVDKTLRAWTHCVTETEEEEAIKNGDSYFLTTNKINLTSANESAVLYFKNDEDRDLIFDLLAVTTDAMTGSALNVFTLSIYKGATAITGGTAIVPLNDNVGSKKTLTVTAEKGAEASAVTGGTLASETFIRSETPFSRLIKLIIPKGAGLAFTVTPAAGNTSFNVVLAAHLRLVTER